MSDEILAKILQDAYFWKDNLPHLEIAEVKWKLTWKISQKNSTT